jgi:hypothetical protein
MPVNHKINKEIKTIFVRADGNVEIEELLDDERKILKNPEFEKGYNKYVDFSGAIPGPNASFDKIIIAADFIQSTQDIRGKSKWSIYAPDQDAYAFSILFARLARDSGVETKVFMNEYQAKKWIGV